MQATERQREGEKERVREKFQICVESLRHCCQQIRVFAMHSEMGLNPSYAFDLSTAVSLL